MKTTEEINELKQRSNEAKRSRLLFERAAKACEALGTSSGRRDARELSALAEMQHAIERACGSEIYGE